MVNDKQVERRNLRMTVARRHHRACTWSIKLRPKVNFILDQWKLGGARSGSIDKCAALKTCRNFFRVSLQKYHSRSFSSRNPAHMCSLSSRLLSQFLTMGGGLWCEPLRKAA